MNVFDIIVIVILIYAAYNGVREGVIIQVCTLLGIALGLYLGDTYCDEAAQLFAIKGEYSSMCGYAIVVIASILVVCLGAYMLRNVLRAAGMGIFDRILGVVLSLCKYLLILSILFTIFEALNGVFNFVSQSSLDSSMLFRPIVNLTQWITPAWDWTQGQIQNINI